MSKKIEMSNGKFMEQMPEGICDECKTFCWFFVKIVYQKENFKICRKCFKRRLGLK